MSKHRDCVCGHLWANHRMVRPPDLACVATGCECKRYEPASAYVYDRDAVIALNLVRAEQDHAPLTGRETYEVRDGKRTGRVLDEKGEPC